MRILLTLLIIAVGATLGGFVGHSQILCADGQCAITGSWYGGAIMGGLLGMLLAGGCPMCMIGRCMMPSESADEPPVTPGPPDLPPEP